MVPRKSHQGRGPRKQRRWVESLTGLWVERPTLQAILGAGIQAEAKVWSEPPVAAPPGAFLQEERTSCALGTSVPRLLGSCPSQAGQARASEPPSPTFCLGWSSRRSVGGVKRPRVAGLFIALPAPAHLRVRAPPPPKKIMGLTAWIRPFNPYPLPPRPLGLFIEKALWFWGSLAQAHQEQAPLSLSLPNSGELRVRGALHPPCHPHRTSEAPSEHREARRILHQARNGETGVSVDTAQKEKILSWQVEKAQNLARCWRGAAPRCGNAASAQHSRGSAWKNEIVSNLFPAESRFPNNRVQVICSWALGYLSSVCCQGAGLCASSLRCPQNLERSLTHCICSATEEMNDQHRPLFRLRR